MPTLPRTCRSWVFVACVVAACSGRLTEPSAADLRSFVASHGAKLEELRDLCFASPRPKTDPRVRALCDELGFIDADRWVSKPERLSFAVYSFGTVAAGTGISICWIPLNQHQEMMRACERQVVPQRISFEKVYERQSLCSALESPVLGRSVAS